jgi:tetratricopeptide (TPR) repeat protein
VLVLAAMGLCRSTRSQDPSEAPAGSGDFAEYVENLRKQYPDAPRVLSAPASLARDLEAFAARRASPNESAAARFLAAEVRLLARDLPGARKVWQEVVDAAPPPQDRARALFLLGESYFLRGEFRTALRHLVQVPELAPDSEWGRAAERMSRYARLQRPGQSVPEFTVTFQAGPREWTCRSTDLKGKVTLFYFWRASSPGLEAFEKTLAADLPKALAEYPVLQGRVDVFGVNLDSRRDDFEGALERLRVTWPQHHDGKGFRTPLAEVFAVPRSPHWLVVDRNGKIAYLGGDSEAFFAKATAALVDLRKSFER